MRPHRSGRAAHRMSTAACLQATAMTRTAPPAYMNRSRCAAPGACILSPELPLGGDAIQQCRSGCVMIEGLAVRHSWVRGDLSMSPFLHQQRSWQRS